VAVVYEYHLNSLTFVLKIEINTNGAADNRSGFRCAISHGQTMRNAYAYQRFSIFCRWPRVQWRCFLSGAWFDNNLQSGTDDIIIFIASSRSTNKQREQNKMHVSHDFESRAVRYAESARACILYKTLGRARTGKCTPRFNYTI
jgi:hypothetical protein